MLKRKRNKKISEKEKARLSSNGGSKYLLCKKCGITEVRTNNDTFAVTCGICVAMMMGMPELPKQFQKSGKPKGWHFKNYFEHEGKIYSRGVEITDPQKISELKLQYQSTEPTSLKNKVSKKNKSKKTVKPSARGKKRANTTG
jgi:rubrerythrin